MKKTNKFIEDNPLVLEKNYEFVEKPGKNVVPIVMVETDNKFLVVENFSNGAGALIVEQSTKQIQVDIDDSEIVYAEEVFEDEDDIYSKELNDRMVEKALHRNFNVIGETIDTACQKNGRSGKIGHNLLSAMQFGKAINVVWKEGIKDDLKVLFRTLSNPEFIVKYEEGNNIAYNQSFNDSISYAKNNPNKPVFVYIEEASARGLLEYIRPIYPYIDNPEGDSYITALGRSIYIPHNLWIIFTLSEKEVIFDVSRRLLRYVSVLNVDLETVKPTERATSIISLEEVKASLREAGETRTLLEDSWKKIDALADLIHRVNGYSLQNKIVRRIEDYAATLFCLEPEEDTVLDLVLSRNVISEAIITNNPLAYSDSNDLYQEINNSFGADKLPLTREVIKTYLALFDKGGNRVND